MSAGQRRFVGVNLIATIGKLVASPGHATRSAFVGAAFRHFGLLAFRSFLAYQPLSDRSLPSGITEM